MRTLQEHMVVRTYMEGFLIVLASNLVISDLLGERTHTILLYACLEHLNNLRCVVRRCCGVKSFWNLNATLRVLLVRIIVLFVVTEAAGFPELLVAIRLHAGVCLGVCA